MKISLPCYGIEIETWGDGGSIRSDLKPDESTPMGAAMHAIEAVILGHAIAGVDVETPAYLEGIETAVDAASNELS